MKNVPLGWLWISAAAVLFGVGAVGWWLGSWTTCSSTELGCDVNIATIEALGTWFGGLATAGGLVFTGVQIRHTVEQAAARRRAELAELRVKARLVGLDVTPSKAAEGHLTTVIVAVKNKSDRYVTDVELFVRDERFGDMQEQIHPEGRWAWSVAVSDFDESITAPHGVKATADRDLAAVVKDRLSPLVAIEYRIGNGHFRRDCHDVGALPD